MEINKLSDEFIKLRESWSSQWQGLPQVMSRCLARLGYEPATLLDQHTQAVCNCIQSVVELVERDGEMRATFNQEPHYHNRLHVADTLVSLTTLLLLQRQCSCDSRSSPSHTEWVAMLTMLSHDLLHDGTINKFSSEIEARSVYYLEPYLQEHRVDQSDQLIIKELILLTDPIMVQKCHDKIRNRVFSILDIDCLAVLIQEADILASTLPDIGSKLAEKLSNEWAKINYQGAHALTTVIGRVEFLHKTALFSSPASNLLEINTLKCEQLLALGSLIHD